MRRALQLARRAQGRTSPNPLVGAVITDDRGQVIAEGYHRRAGQDHAEVVALKKAGAKARGQTLYVTLEPCNHVGRTPACTQAIIAAGIRCVVVAMRDPNPTVTGGGIEALRAAQIAVEVGDGAQAAYELNRPFITWSLQRRPFVTLKAAVSADGKIASAFGESKYLTSPAALRHAHQLRRQHDAILVGVGTVLADNPELTYRGPAPGQSPARVVLDSRGRTPLDARLLCTVDRAPVWIYTTDDAARGWIDAVRQRGAAVIVTPRTDRGVVALDAVLTDLARRQCLSVLVEGGAQVHASFWALNQVDRWVLYVAPKILGGNAPSPVAGEGFHLSQAPQLRLRQLTRVGVDAVLDFDVAQDRALPDHALLSDATCEVGR
jgi:diaminohydroxyphosphoribosylaminopyrimidine deaminase/5-amino-6-(5-phosphoribosylamino)uracil reductase